MIQAARDTSTVQYKYRMQFTHSRLSPVMKICAHELTSAIYCIAWSFFSLQQAKSYNFQKYRVTKWTVCTRVMSKLSY